MAIASRAIAIGAIARGAGPPFASFFARTRTIPVRARRPTANVSLMCIHGWRRSEGSSTRRVTPLTTASAAAASVKRAARRAIAPIRARVAGSSPAALITSARAKRPPTQKMTPTMCTVSAMGKLPSMAPRVLGGPARVHVSGETAAFAR